MHNDILIGYQFNLINCLIFIAGVTPKNKGYGNG